VTTEPANPAAESRDGLRAGHADREQVIETLKTAFVDGRLTKDELDTRAGQALTACTYGDLAALTNDIPPSLPAAGVARPPALARSRPLARAAAKSGLCLVIAAAAVWMGVLFGPGGPGTSPGVPFLAIALALLITAFGIMADGIATAAERRVTPRQLPPGPGPAATPLDSERNGGTRPGPRPHDPRTEQNCAGSRARRSQYARQHFPTVQAAHLLA
jgi:Domain of unknown function (DUF1707)